MALSGALILILLVSAGAAFLTFFSGFGLGTILLPVFSIFLPVEVAVGATALVHFITNIIKGSLVFRHADRGIVIRFGTVSILGALAGAWLFTLMDAEILRKFSIGSLAFEMNLPGIVIGTILIVFSFLEMLPAGKGFQIGRSYLLSGGFISGFFGGLSGHQGALRTAFLARTGLGKEAFVATGVLIACLVDITRIPVYAGKLTSYAQWEDPLFITTLVCSCTGAAAGAVIGNYTLKKSSYSFVRSVVSVFLLLMGILMIMGIRW
ncbi:MAG: sulfite exporter TauE/SafE family protein [Bacteroidia bacterium]|nr:sulfite exporter TauE/SafE family protein [Bacteroidia bacterium]